MSKNVNFSVYSAEQLRFMVALADPEDHRTQNEIAEALHVRPETLSRWKREPGFGEAVWELTFRNLESEIGRVSSVLRKQALQGDSRSIRLFYELMGKVGSQRTSSPCTRNHVVNGNFIYEMFEGMCTEQQADDFLRQVAEYQGIAYPPALMNHVNEADDVSISDEAQLLVA